MVKSVLWGRESILSAPKSYPSLLEIGSRTERLGVPRKRLILSSISRFLVFEGLNVVGVALLACIAVATYTLWMSIAWSGKIVWIGRPVKL